MAADLALDTTKGDQCKDGRLWHLEIVIKIIQHIHSSIPEGDILDTVFAIIPVVLSESTYRKTQYETTLERCTLQ